MSNDENNRLELLAMRIAGIRACRNSAQTVESNDSLIEQISAEVSSEEILLKKPNKSTSFEDIKAYIAVKLKHSYQAFMDRQTYITAKHMPRLRAYIQPMFDDLVKSKVLKRANVVCDWRVNTQVSIADNDLVCFVIYETPNGSIVGVTACQNPIHARIDALQAAKQMPGIRRI